MKTAVPFVDLHRIHQPLKDAFLAKVSTLIDSSQFVLGTEVENFEKEFAEYNQSKYCVGVSNGLDALTLALLALGIGPGDEVIVPANTFIATAYAVTHTGAKPVFCDVDLSSATLNPKLLSSCLTSKTRAVIPVHLYGQSAEMDPIIDFCKKNKLKIVEDTAQAHGAKWGTRHCGTLGDIGCFSFYPGKNLGALGEGGAIITSDPQLAERVKMIRNVGQKQKNIHEMIGGNYRLHSMQAAFLRLKLPHLNSYNQQRFEAAKIYIEELKNCSNIELPKIFSDRSHIFHLFVIQNKNAADRDPLNRFLNDAGIQTGIHYPTPLHLQPCYQNLGYSKDAFPVSKKLGDSILSLPIFPGIKKEEIVLVCQTIKNYFKN